MSASRPGRGVRVVAVLVVVLLALLLAIDRITPRVVAGLIAAQAQRSEGLAARPDVSLGGFPFLTQVWRGNYRDVRVDVRGQVEQGLRVDRVHAELVGAHVPPGDVVHGDVRRIPVDRLTAQVELTFTDLNAYLRSQGSAVEVGSAGTGIRVSGSLDVLGATVDAVGTADISVAPTEITFTPRELTAPVGASLSPAISQLLTVRVPVVGLPFNLRLTSATVRSDRIVFGAAGQNVVLDPNVVGRVTGAESSVRARPFEQV
ncbi:DUF2993 domain-containing protein [Frankia sp. R82]|uniref:LmeA family phospholipid-binding protein n=1 Tax=Frankia sp. R82 TaxID=2950553 RepID=UPI00204304EF|nr:DUF2993 domain-containing protein [Frankia sp. R82]MCM3885459.1 DUF2993 domain-containing protein [Frankia sp. R82]